ncbi:MAG TPA: phosphoglycerate dehydrogenase [Actinomycetota bacterium]|nr:phosphoglycerate dehydrogenase [Actinomycetota bacterium]
MRALLLENIHPEAATALERAGYAVRSLDRALAGDELADALGGVQLLGIRSKSQVTAEHLRAADALLAVGAFCIGTDQIDLPAATDRGIAVFNAPYSNTRSVVELALAEIIALTRRMVDKNRLMHAGVWDKSAAGAHEVRGRVLGIIGYGNIGAQLSVLAEALGMVVYFYDTADKLALGNARRCGSLNELLAVADVVTLHVDGRKGNAGLFGEAQFQAMKQGALFLNLSRGFVIDTNALRVHLESGQLGGAALDVFQDEPSSRDEEFRNDLRGLPNVILTPHIGGSTLEAQEDIGRFVAGKLLDFVADGSTVLSVNLPPLTLAEHEGTHRLAHLHNNVPGVLAAINSVLAEHGVNVEGQLLGTRGESGYVLTDIGVDYSDQVLEQLRALPETVRLRVLS